jgi:hypothetical protein
MTMAGDQWSLDTADALAGTRGVVRVRVGPGVLRNFDIARTIAGFPVPADRRADVEAALGEEGWFGPHGIDRFMGALRRLGVRNGRASTDHTDVHVTAGYRAFSLPGAVVARGWPPAPEVAAYLSAGGLEFSGDGSSGPKDAAVTGSLADVLAALDGRRPFLIGSPRTRALARVLGVAAGDHVIIPDTGAYDLTDELLTAARRFVAGATDRPAVILHAASLVGNTVLLELAASGARFIGIDLGLAATLFDHEYLSTRGWFIEHGAGILRTADALAVRAGADHEDRRTPRAAADRHARLVACGRAWRHATRLWRADARQATDMLLAALAGNDDLRLPIVRATSLLWRRALGERVGLDEADALLAEPDKPEPAAIAGLLCHAAGHTDRALKSVDRAVAMSPRDGSLRHLRQAIAEDSPAGCPGTIPASLLTYPERPYLGSRLSWSLSGDLPRLWPDA